MTSGEHPVDEETSRSSAESRESSTQGFDPNDFEEPTRPTPSMAARRASTPDVIAPDPEVGDVLAGYALRSVLGRGGAGTVFKAERVEDGAVVALKVLSASKVKRARVVQRFFDEVRAARRVQHDGLIHVLDFIEEESPRRLAYAMEYVEGEMLRTRLKREGSLDLRLAIQIAIQICDALSALHKEKIVHRDLKPENILIAGTEEEPRVKLLDFGVVKFLPVDPTQGSSESHEKPGTFVGTPRYMAPEQAAGTTIDARADLFAIGVMLFEMITGRCPHEGDSLRDVVLAKLKGAPRITVNPEKEILPQELTEIVDACLQLKPALRPKHAGRVSSALSDAMMVLFAVGPIRAPESNELAPAGSSSAEHWGESSIEAPAALSSTQDVPTSPEPPRTGPDQYRALILGLIAVVVVASALIGVLLLRRMKTPEESIFVVPPESVPVNAVDVPPTKTATSS